MSIILLLKTLIASYISLERDMSRDFLLKMTMKFYEIILNTKHKLLSLKNKLDRNKELLNDYNYFSRL